jgi:hypothetical protein
MPGARHSVAAALGVVAALFLCASSSATAQTPAAATGPPWEPPRTPDGQPDIQGYWTNLQPADKRKNFFSYSLTGEGAEVHDRVAGRAERRYDSIVIAPGGKVPYRPEVLTLREEYLVNHLAPKKLEHVDTRMRCILTGAPRLLYSSGAPRILQVPGYVLLLTEWNHAYRIIRLDGQPHVGPNITLWTGDSQGRWEGNTLVVDATNHKPGWLDNSGNFYSDALHVVERWTLVDANTIHYEATVEDPKVLAAPFTLAFTMTRRTDPDYEQLEEACHEGNLSLPHMYEKAWMAGVPR